MRSFAPVPASTVNIDVAATSASVQLGSPTQVRVMNNGTATAWITFGASSVTAALATGSPVGPGVTEVFTVPDSLVNAPIYVAAIAAGSTGKIYFTPGAGI